MLFQRCLQLSHGKTYARKYGVLYHAFVQSLVQLHIYTIFQIALPVDLRGWHSHVTKIARLQPWLRAIVCGD